MSDTTQGATAANVAVAANAEAQAAAAAQTEQTNGAAQASVAAGAETKEPEVKSYWPEDWKQKVAEYVGAGNKKTIEKELKRLESIPDPTGIYAQYRAMENTWSSRNFIKLPPKENATEADLKEYHKALGVPEKPEGYFKEIKLANGAVIGEADKPVADAFAAAVHKVGATPQVVNAALDWYFTNQEQAATALDDADDKFRREAELALKEEFGSSFKRKTNAIASLFEIAPGGADVKNESSLFARLMGGRTADGKIIGNDPDMVRFLTALALDRNPSASVVEDGDQTGKTIETELAEIAKFRKENKSAYFRDQKMLARERELIEARDKIRSRQRA